MFMDYLITARIRLAACALSVLLLTGCASTASKVLEKQRTPPQAAPVEFDYLNLARKSQVYVTFHMTEDGVFIDRQSDDFDLRDYQLLLEKQVDKGVVDCVLMATAGKDGRFSICHKDAISANSIFKKQVMSKDPVSAAIGTVFWTAFTPLCILNPSKAASCIAGGYKNAAGVSDVVDKEAIGKVGAMANAALYRDYKYKTENLDQLVGSSDLNSAQTRASVLSSILQYSSEYPNAPLVDRASEAFLGNCISLQDYGAFQIGFTKLKPSTSDSVLERILSKALASEQFPIAKLVYQGALKGKLGTHTDLLEAYKAMALSQGTFDDAFEFASGGGDRTSLKVAYDKAATDEEKRMIERQIIFLVRDKMVITETSIDGSGTTESNGGSLWGRVFGTTNVSAKVRSRVDYTFSFNQDIYKPNFDYVITAKVRITVKGRVRGERNCGFLWLSRCEFDEEASHTHDQPVRVVLTQAGGYRDQGSTSIEWNSVSGGSGFASGFLMGGVKVFQGTDLALSVVDIGIEESK